MNSNYQSVVAKLRTLLAALKVGGDYQKIVEARDIVLKRFGSVFKKEGVANLTEEEFKSFLRFENNQHWTGLHRQGPRITMFHFCNMKFRFDSLETKKIKNNF